jgi:hypothetical protein
MKLSSGSWMQSVNYMDHHLCKLVNESFTEYSTITFLEMYHSYNMIDPMEKCDQVFTLQTVQY